MTISTLLTLNLGGTWQLVPPKGESLIVWHCDDGRRVTFTSENSGSYWLYDHEGVDRQPAEPWLSNNALQEALKQAILDHCVGLHVSNVVVPKDLRDRLNGDLNRTHGFKQALIDIEAYGPDCTPHGCDCPTIAERAL